MKTTALVLSLLLAHTAAQASAIYECTDRSGRKTYSQDGGRNCKTSNLGRASVYTSAAPVYREETPAAASESSQTQAEGADAARRELEQAQAALEEGKKVRLGNERNYAKYLERVQGLENKVKAAQDKVKAAQGGAGQGGLE